MFVWHGYKTIKISKYATKGRFSENRVGNLLFSLQNLMSKNEKLLFCLTEKVNLMLVCW